MFARRVGPVLGLVLALLLSIRPAFAQPVSVGGKDFTEQKIIAEMTAQLLEARGLPVSKRVRFTTTALRRAQEAGRIDLYWEYTGTSLTVFNGITEPLDAAAGHARVKTLDAEKGLVWLTPSKVDNTFAIAMRRRAAAQLRIGTLSDLAAAVNRGVELKLGTTEEFSVRPDGLRSLEKAYGFEIGGWNVETMDNGRIYGELAKSTLDLGLVFATDGRVVESDFLVLRDDKGHFPAYLMTPVIRKETLDRHPQLAVLLNDLSSRLDNAIMSRLNAMVDIERRSPETVASEFLKNAGLT